ncbi:hypothetical protein Q4I32_002887 [Leishmania shawi]|uniref:Proteophosphoglycan ppg4 n=1 Tax=Leishmania shawi TaxID=5680 RepID=A0AAW3BZK3_9TRYP
MMTHRESTDCSSATLPASMQTLLDRYTDRQLTQQERLVLAHATPRVRCEALRIFFEMNDAAAGLEYVLANGGASLNSHGDTSAKASLSSGAAATASTAVPLVAASKALKSLPINTLTATSAGAKLNTAAASDAKRPFAASAPNDNTALQDDARKPRGTGRTAVPASGSTAPSLVTSTRSCLRRTSAARRGESVCTLVTVSSMSSESSDGDNELRPTETPVKEEEVGADMPATVTLRYRGSRSSAVVASAAPIVPALALGTVLKQHDSISRSSPSARVAHSEYRPSVSPALTTTTVAANAQPRDVSPSVAPPPHTEPFSPATPKSGITGTAGTQGSAPVTPPPLPPTRHEGAGDDEEPRKTVAAKLTAYHANPTATLAASAPHPQQKHCVGFTDSKARTVLSAYRRGCTSSTFRHHHEDVRLAYTEPLCNHRSPSSSCTPPPPWLAGGGTTSVCGTDWAALVAAAPVPPLPVASVVTATKPATGVLGSPRTSRRPAPKEVACTTPAPSLRFPSSPTKALGSQAKTAHGSELGDAAAAGNNSGGAGKTQPPPRTPRVSFEGKKPKSGGSGNRSPRRKRRSDSGVSKLSPPSPSSKLSGASPVKRGVAWDETTGTYITHPNQRQRQGAAHSVAVAAGAATLTALPSAAPRGVGTSALEIPDKLHYYFARTASSTVASGDMAAAQAAKPTPFGPLCSSAMHFGRGEDATSALSAAAALLSAKAVKQKKCESEATRSKTPTGVSTWKKSIETKMAAAALAAPLMVVPAVRSPRLAENQRFRSGCVPAKYDLCGPSGETIMVQHQGPQYPPQLLAAAAAPANVSPKTPPRTASAGKMVQLAAEKAPAVRFERYYSMMSGGGVEVVEVETAQSSAHASCPSAIRTPRSARFPAQQQPRGRVGDPVAAMYARGWAANPTYQACGAAAQVCAGPVPPAQCSVFERLTSNYYNVYSSATALQAVSPPPVAFSPRGDRSDRERHQLPHRRNLSAPVARTHRGRARCPATLQAVPKGFLSPRGMRKGEQERTAAPVSSVFARSNASS